MRLAVLIPVKAFSTAKGRLATVLSPAQRAELARRTATAVLRAAGVQPTFVVCDDHDVAEWAEANGATVLWRPGHGLNPAVTDGVATLAGKGYDHAIIAHSDLLLADRLDHVAWAGGITLVPDRIHDGTNVISLPTALPFGFSYGGGSFHRHLAEAARLEHPARVVRDERLGLDIDTPSDLAHPSIQEALSSPPTSRANRP